MSLKNRINECLLETNSKKVDLAKATKSPRATISDWTSGKTKSLSGKKLLLASNYFGVNPDWLGNGDGPKYKKNKGQFFGTPDYKSDLQELSADYVNTDKVPLISWVSAGIWCEAIDNYNTGDAEQWLPCPQTCSASTYALRVNGDSMTSTVSNAKSYPEGCIIYVDPLAPIINGKRVIAKLPGSNEVTFKTYKEDAGKKWLMPINPQYEKILIDETVIICGVVIAKYEPE